MPVMDKEDIYQLLAAHSLEDLRKLACEQLETHCGRHVHARGLIEFSNICRRNCAYCGLRVQNRRLRRYRLSIPEIMEATASAIGHGVDSIVLQSGEGACDPHWLAEVVREIRGSCKVPVTLSVGEAPERDYELWRQAGASRYLLKHETADPALYSRLHPGYTLADRLLCLHALAELGYETGSGFIIGLPGQTLRTIASDIALCVRLGVRMCGAGPFIPQGRTPLANWPSPPLELALVVMSVLRIALPRANLPATTALATLDPQNGQTLGLMAGGNVLMPGFTPAAYARDYAIYDAKNRAGVGEALRSVRAANRVCSLRLGTTPPGCAAS